MTITLLDIARANGSDAIVGLVDETSKAHPEITGSVMFGGEARTVPGVGDSRTIRGLNYKTLVRTGLPSVGFRHANEGTGKTKGVYENRTVETFILNPRWGSDKAVADKYEDGPSAYIAMEGMGHVESAMQRLASQFYYGRDETFGHAKGFPGLLEAYDPTNMVVDAGGTTDNEASSVWAVKFGPADVRWVWGAGGNLDLSEVDERNQSDGEGNEFTAYHQELLAYPGLQVASVRSVGRIKKLTTDNGKGLTDSLVSALLAKFEVGKYPDVLFASRRSVQQLQDSRTAHNTTGAPAPFPTEAFGVPILPTDAISEVETLAL